MFTYIDVEHDNITVYSYMEYLIWREVQDVDFQFCYINLLNVY